MCRMLKVWEEAGTDLLGFPIDFADLKQYDVSVRNQAGFLPKPRRRGRRDDHDSQRKRQLQPLRRRSVCILLLLLYEGLLCRALFCIPKAYGSDRAARGSFLICLWKLRGAVRRDGARCFIPAPPRIRSCQCKCKTNHAKEKNIMKKKILAIILAAAMLLTLAACASTAAPSRKSGHICGNARFRRDG